MTDDAAKPVQMEAVKAHTFGGKAYNEGDRYPAAPEFVETLTILQYAKVADAKAAEAKPAKATATHPGKK